MNIDFHTHGNLSKKIPVTVEEFIEKMEEAKQNGLTAIALTEHFNAMNFFELYEMLDRHFEYRKNYYMVNGVKVFPGIEIDVKEIGHFLVVGDREDIKAIRRKLSDHLEEADFLPVRELIDLLHPYDVLKIGAHPFRESTPWTHHEEDVLTQFDAFDINGKDLHKYGLAMKQRVEELAEQFGTSAVGGSDTHQLLQYGSVVNEFPDCETIQDLKGVIRRGDYAVFISPAIDTKVKAAKMVKNLLKKEYVAL
ncbi:PHP domain-containing protein [Halobacillus sp. SY10]|uniref:PHP domain-containing protein n=1 Tax=Halobacillus sp. SY10 TaxID=3381356 RepID=UPI00387922DC